jgi:hypothetical protein
MANNHPSSSSVRRPPTMTTTTRLCCTRAQHHHDGAVAHNAFTTPPFTNNHAHKHSLQHSRCNKEPTICRWSPLLCFFPFVVVSKTQSYEFYTVIAASRRRASAPFSHCCLSQSAGNGSSPSTSLLALKHFIAFSMFSRRTPTTRCK